MIFASFSETIARWQVTQGQNSPDRVGSELIALRVCHQSIGGSAGMLPLGDRQLRMNLVGLKPRESDRAD
ncbi:MULTISPECIES: hypothetical protein [Planktothricoides]|uniref:Uncharacterized protein n=2 Tax=Planktothricoides raciborskii TaxID=132608 RepID=A0AAU8JE82_9CYAN|nr:MULTISPECIES: hypothetical protein [Planktothricoides]KOR33668.1 hypothetical protein AM228_28530 [Planktothricoides sp. SR001]MBD2547232.1 hypothetical protein [Planktothricoides raciborskii FACHB-1370]MBD2585764.1 hypothetical protein [Planktothricoides raciborskii FACHB-1261]